MSNSVPNERKRLIKTILLDLLAVGICLNVFAYFHHVRKAEPAPKALTSPTPVVSTSGVAPAAEPSAAPETSATEAPAAADTGLLGGKFAEKAHEALANFMLAVVLVHLAGVFVGSLAHRENLVRAMVLGVKRAAPQEAIERPYTPMAVVLFVWVAIVVYWLLRQ